MREQSLNFVVRGRKCVDWCGGEKQRLTGTDTRLTGLSEMVVVGVIALEGGDG